MVLAEKIACETLDFVTMALRRSLNVLLKQEQKAAVMSFLKKLTFCIELFLTVPVSCKYLY